MLTPDAAEAIDAVAAELIGQGSWRQIMRAFRYALARHAVARTRTKRAAGHLVGTNHMTIYYALQKGPPTIVSREQIAAPPCAVCALVQPLDTQRGSIPLAERVNDYAWALVLDALRTHRGNVTRAAAALRVNRATLSVWLTRRRREGYVRPAYTFSHAPRPRRAR